MAIAVLLIGGCALGPLARSSAPARFIFKYQASGGDNTMNQILKIGNPRSQSYALVLKFARSTTPGPHCLE